HRVPLHLAGLAVLAGIAAPAIAAPSATPAARQTAAPLAHLPAQLRSCAARASSVRWHPAPRSAW
ncbi:hypothetical protein, partial [Xanthomonas vasicola]